MGRRTRDPSERTEVSYNDLGGDYMGDTSKNSLKCTLKIHALHPPFVCYASIKKKKE